MNGDLSEGRGSQSSPQRNGCPGASLPWGFLFNTSCQLGVGVFYFIFSFYFDFFFKKTSEVEGASFPHPVPSQLMRRWSVHPCGSCSPYPWVCPAGWVLEARAGRCVCGLGAQRKVIHQEEGQQALLVPDSHHSAQEMETSPFLGLKKAEERTLASFKFLQLLLYSRG